MSNIKHKRGRYSRYENAIIAKSIQRYGTAKGLDLAASQLNRRRDGIEKHYYTNMATKKTSVPSVREKTTTSPKTDKVDVAVPKEVKSVQLNVAGIELYLTFK